MDDHDEHTPQVDAREAVGLQVGHRNVQINLHGGGVPPTAPTVPVDRGRRRHLYYMIGENAGTKFNMIPPVARSYPSEALSGFLKALERADVPPHLRDAIRARAGEAAAAPSDDGLRAGVYAFAAAVDEITDELRDRSVGDEFDWFKLADLIARISLIVRALWPADPTREAEVMRVSLHALAERLDAPTVLRDEIRKFATMKLPTATIEEFLDAAIRLQELCYRLL